MVLVVDGPQCPVVVKELLSGGHLATIELFIAPMKSPTTGRPGVERWFTEEQALFVTSQAGTRSPGPSPASSCVPSLQPVTR